MESHENRVRQRELIELIGRELTAFYAKFAVCFGVVLVAFALLYGPLIKPWSQEQMGLARLKQAEYDNQIRAEKAQAERDAAELRAQAIMIVGDAAKQYPDYRSQELIGGFAKAMEGDIPLTFYVTTRDNMPILPSVAVPSQAAVTSLED